jgi:hypothetical protein
VAHSVELLLDAHSEAAIRSIWQTLDDAGLPSQAHVTSPTNRPHVTLIAAQGIDPDVDEELRPLAALFPVGCLVGAALVLGGPKHTLARLIVPSSELLDLHAEVYRRCLPYVVGDPFDHCRPGHWTPHVTLCRRLGADQIGDAVSVAGATAPNLAADVAGLRRWDSDQRIDRLLVGR